MLKRATVLLLAFASSATSAALSQSLTSVSPDVIPAGATAATITVRGRALGGISNVRFQNCTGDTANAPIAKAARLTVRVPAAMLRTPCVLRVRAAESMVELPLVVADPALLALAVPPPSDPDELHPWRGEFNRRCDEDADTTSAPLFQSQVAVYSDSAVRGTFVLGKLKRAVMRVTTVAPKVRPSAPGQVCTYVVLPGVEPDDVRSGPADVEGFWIGVLAPDGKTIRDVQFLSDMVQAP